MNHPAPRTVARALPLLLLPALLLTAPPLQAAVSETDLLIQLLVKKGMITAEEAAGLRAEVAVAKQEERDQRRDLPVEASRALKLSGYTQIRDRAEGSARDTFDVRRARLDLRGTAGAGFDYRLQTEFAGSSAKLLDATVGWRFADSLRLTAGQFKIPFSQENLLSSPKLETINRSQVVEALVARRKHVEGNQNGRDIGLMASGTLRLFDQPGWLEYSIGVFNGSGINASDTNDQKDLAGRLSVRPLAGLSVGASVYSGKYALRPPTITEAGRDRLGLEFAYSKGPLLLKGETIGGRDAQFDKDGWYLLGGAFLVPGRLQAVLRYDTFDPDTATPHNESGISTVGLNWLVNRWSLLQVNYERRDESGPEVSNDALAAQLTLQF